MDTTGAKIMPKGLMKLKTGMFNDRDENIATLTTYFECFHRSAAIKGDNI
jgi:hypothetical protein